MAYNSWDKLSKAQRDYPKPKFAVAVVDKALKKNPSNPFLLAWKVDLGFTVGNIPPADILKNITTISSHPGLTDVRFLSYFYSLCAQACRSQQPGTIVCSIGNEWLKPWQDAAKKFSRKRERLDLWDALFLAALHDDCWEDVRFAVTNYSKDTALTKELHYTRILAQLNAAQQKRRALGKDDQMTTISLTLTRRQMKQSFEAKLEDAVAIRDIRDLRYMAEIYSRQECCTELWDLWDSSPGHLQELMAKHKDDLTSLKTRLLRQQKDWTTLEQHCYKTLDEVLTKVDTDSGDSKSMWELCSWNYLVWDSLMESLRHTGSTDDAKQKLLSYVDRCFDTVSDTKSRPLQLTNLALRQFLGTPLLQLCKDYWNCHHSLPSCYIDLASSLEALSVEERKEFFQHALDHVKSIHAETEADFSKWQQTQSNLLKVQYLLTISAVDSPSRESYEAIFEQSIALIVQGADHTDAGFLAIYSLLRLHHQTADGSQDSTLLLQAAMLSQHLVAKDNDKENRTLALLAARLHLNLGLGKIAFRLYSHVKCKEMLQDTLAPYVLSNISMSQPFLSGYQGYSAEDELDKAIGTIERMEGKTDSFIFRKMSDFLYDQAFEALEMKRKFKSSRTRKMCTVELARMARLSGEPVDDIDGASDESLSDNMDRSVFPSFERTKSSGPLSFIMPNDVPDYHSKNSIWPLQNLVSRVLNKEGSLPSLASMRSILDSHTNTQDSTSAYTTFLHESWRNLCLYTISILYPDSKPSDLQPIDLSNIRAGMESLSTISTTTSSSNPDIAPTLFHEFMLSTCYAALELLRATSKLIALLREKVFTTSSTKSSPPHPLKSTLPESFADDLDKDTKACYAAVRDVASTYTNQVKKLGAKGIWKQVLAGKTGDVLRGWMDEEDVEHYARGYVEGAVEGWGGVLKVKL